MSDAWNPPAEAPANAAGLTFGDVWPSLLIAGLVPLLINLTGACLGGLWIFMIPFTLLLSAVGGFVGGVRVAGRRVGGLGVAPPVIVPVASAFIQIAPCALPMMSVPLWAPTGVDGLSAFELEAAIMLLYGGLAVFTVGIGAVATVGGFAMKRAGMVPELRPEVVAVGCAGGVVAIGLFCFVWLVVTVVALTVLGNEISQKFEAIEKQQQHAP